MRRAGAAAAARFGRACTDCPAQVADAYEAPVAKAAASIDLGSEVPAMKGYEFAQSISTVAPGAGRAWHSHVGTPEIVHVVSGVLTDARNGEPSVQYGPGSTIVNAHGTQHMWANLSAGAVVIITTIIRPAP